MTDRTCYIHIGLHKTGSTAIQRLLTDHADRLAAAGVYRPQAATEQHRHNHSVLAGEINRPGSSGDAARRLSREIDEAGRPAKVLITAEALSAHVAETHVRDALADLTAGLGYDRCIIAYVRPQPDAVNSRFTQLVKNWTWRSSFGAYFRRQLKQRALDYMTRFGPLLDDERFRVIVRPYNGEVLSRGIAADFLAQLGLSDDEIANFPPADDFNVTPGPKTVAAFPYILQALRSGPPISREHLGATTRLILRMAGERGWNEEKFDGLNAARLDALRSAFAQSNANFARRVWHREWNDVFPGEDARPAAPNLFRPRGANKSERRDFMNFVAEMTTAIRALSRTSLKAPVRAPAASGGQKIRRRQATRAAAVSGGRRRRQGRP
jgi:hypothetical protein